MLPPFIIEQIRKREEEKAAEDQPRLELPLERHRPSRAPEPAKEEDRRGVIILEL